MIIFIVDQSVCNFCPLFLIVWSIKCPEIEQDVDPCFQKPQMMTSFCPKHKIYSFHCLRGVKKAENIHNLEARTRCNFFFFFNHP